MTVLQKRIAGVQSAIPPIEAKVIEDFDRLTRAQTLKESVDRDQGLHDHLLGTLQTVGSNKNVQEEAAFGFGATTAPQPEKRDLPIRDCAGASLRIGEARPGDRFMAGTRSMTGLLPSATLPTSLAKRCLDWCRK